MKFDPLFFVVLTVLPTVVPPAAAGEDLVAVRAANANAFAFDLYGELAKAPGNLFCSPYSVSGAFAMVAAATDGQTLREVREVLHFEQAPAVVDESMAALRAALRSERGGRGFVLRVANRMWGAADAPAGYFQQPFLDLARSRYDAAFEVVDFGDEETARATINDWVADRTEKKIPELIPAGVLDELVRLVLTNAIYFKGTWQHEFDPEATRDAPFHVSPEKDVTVKMMFRKASFRAARTDEFTLIELPYTGERISMLVFLPHEGQSVESAAGSLSGPRLADLRAQLAPEDTRLYLPRFRYSSKYRLHETALPALGMRTPFEFTSDWKPLNGGVEELKISHVIHEAFIEVNEEGTEAAAATAVVAKRKGPGSPMVRVDRPFLFLIQERTSGLILFLGRVTDPG